MKLVGGHSFGASSALSKVGRTATILSWIVKNKSALNSIVIPVDLPAQKRENESRFVRKLNLLDSLKIGDLSMDIAGYIAANGISAFTVNSSWFCSSPSSGSLMPMLDGITTVTNVFFSISESPPAATVRTNKCVLSTHRAW